MKTRILSACIMLPLLILVYLGGIWLDIAVAIISALAVKELGNGFREAGFRPEIAYMSVAVLFAFGCLKISPELYLPLWIFGVMLAALIGSFRMDRMSLGDVTVTAFIPLYAVFFFHFVTLINHSIFPHLIWLVFLAAFGTDIFAYFTGYVMGKHKLCPNLSPKKTVEGAIGGVLGSVLSCVLFGVFVLDGIVAAGMSYMPWFHYVLIGLLGSVIAQIGDLSASSLKRRMGIKDYGNLIPGHGGIMDRFDSVLMVAPFIYFYGTIFFSIVAKG